MKHLQGPHSEVVSQGPRNGFERVMRTWEIRTSQIRRRLLDRLAPPRYKEGEELGWVSIELLETLLEEEEIPIPSCAAVASCRD